MTMDPRILKNHRYSEHPCPWTRYPCMEWPYERHWSASEHETEKKYREVYLNQCRLLGIEPAKDGSF